MPSTNKRALELDMDTKYQKTVVMGFIKIWRIFANNKKSKAASILLWLGGHFYLKGPAHSKNENLYF